MPVAGGRAQKRVNEPASNHNLDPGSLRGSGAAHHDALQEVVGWNMEDWEELEALLEAEHLILGQQQQQADVNLLHSPEHPPHLPPEAPPSRSSSRRSLPRTRGGFSVPLHQLSSILLNMTFSDAEDEHPTAGRNTSNEQERSLSRSRTESGVSNASTVSLASPSSSAGRAATSNGPGPATLGGARGEDIVAAAQNATVADMTGVDKKKIVEKLQQIQGYIQQTTAAMAALEQQGDIGLQSDIYARYVHLNSSLQHQEEEYLDILARSLVLNKAAAQVANGTQQSTAPSSSLATQVNGQDETVAEEGSRVVGVISANNVLTLQDRLSASQDESVSIMGQMRASIARREGLLSRYKATQERLANLKKQRQGIQEEKHRLLTVGTAVTAVGTTPEEDDDPIPGAENWTLAEVTQSLVDFQTLQVKVERLSSIYNVRAQDVSADDEEGQTDMNNKLGLLASRRRTLADVVTRLKGFQVLRQQEERDGMEGEEGGGRSGSGAPARAPDSNHASDSHGHAGRGDEAPPATQGTSMPSVNGEESANSAAHINLRAAAESVSQANEELVSRKAQLSSLQKQLSDMKKLLDVANMAKMAQQGEEGEGAISLPATEEELEEAGPGEFMEVSGNRVVLTEIERQNPEIASKYTQLSQAKERLAKMEDVISMIGQARQSGQNLREVLPSDYLAILEEAEEEFPQPGGRAASQSLPAPPRLADLEEDVVRLARRPIRPPRATSTGRSEGGAGLGRDSQSQESREISAMQQQLNKTSTRVSVNERSRHGNEKGAIKKQPQVLWQGNSGGGVSRGSGAGEDPRQAQVLVLQEELRQKKNALEALTRRMGKSSSLNMDNISDNLSDNVSETSDNLGDARGSSGAATWGEAGGLHHFSDNHYQQSSDEDLIEEDEADLPPRSQCRPQHPPPPTVSPKDRNRHSGSHHRRRQDSGRLSINNLSTALPTPSRTKHNRLRSGSAPKALWESVGTPDGANYKSPSNTTMQTQHSLNTALNQLNQVQGTINTLQECLRQEQSQVLGGARPSHYQPQLVAPLLPDLTPTSLPPGVPPSQALTPMSAYAGLGSLALAAQGGGETMNQQLLAGMQQCFSQLHLHSLEIQALSKHLQVRRPFLYYPTTQFPPYQPYQ